MVVKWWYLLDVEAHRHAGLAAATAGGGAGAIWELGIARHKTIWEAAVTIWRPRSDLVHLQLAPSLSWLSSQVDPDSFLLQYFTW